VCVCVCVCVCETWFLTLREDKTFQVVKPEIRISPTLLEPEAYPNLGKTSTTVICQHDMKFPHIWYKNDVKYVVRSVGLFDTYLIMKYCNNDRKDL
jgi:hypothetical protein